MWRNCVVLMNLGLVSMDVMLSSHCVSSCLFHIVWCTKYRHPVLVGGVYDACKEFLFDICNEYNWKILALEVMPDHVHILLRIPSSLSISSVVGTLKSISCNRIFKNFPSLKKERFWGSGLWSLGYFVNTVGNNLQMVQNYINTQYARPYEQSHR